MTTKLRMMAQVMSWPWKISRAIEFGSRSNDGTRLMIQGEKVEFVIEDEGVNELGSDEPAELAVELRMELIEGFELLVEDLEN